MTILAHPWVVLDRFGTTLNKVGAILAHLRALLGHLGAIVETKARVIALADLARTFLEPSLARKGFPNTYFSNQVRGLFLDKLGATSAQDGPTCSREVIHKFLIDEHLCLPEP